MAVLQGCHEAAVGLPVKAPQLVPTWTVIASRHI